MSLSRLLCGTSCLIFWGSVLGYAQTQHFQYTSNTGNNATVIIPVTANPNINGTPLDVGDEIGVFTPSGRCVGAVIWNNFNTAITVWGDNDQTPEIDGIQVGEIIQYRVWKSSADIEYASVSVRYLQGGDGRYAVDAIYTLSSLDATAPPAPPVLLLPPDGATGVATTITFEWEPSDHATSYRLQVATNADFTTTVVDESGLSSTGFSASGLLYNTTYYWRVNASNSGGTSDYSSPRQFTTAPPPRPAKPLLNSPANGSVDQPLTMTLRWEAAANAETYQLQLSMNSTFTQLVTNATGVVTTSFDVSSLATGTQYYWRVRGENTGGTGDWSDPWAFTTIPDPPDVPVLTAPQDGSVDQPLTMRVIWYPAARASSYGLQVSTSPSFSSLAIDAGGITTTSAEIGPLDASTQYYWRVRASNSGGISNWSAIWHFRTVPPQPQTPTLLSPENGANNQPTTLLLAWEAASGAATYHLQLSTDPQFSTTIINDSTLAGTTRQVQNLTRSTNYYWRVRAKNSGGISGWSAVWVFTTSSGLPPPPATPSLSSPANGATNERIPVTLSWNSSSGASSYRVQVSSRSDFGTLLANEAGITTTTYSVTTASFNTTYYWRVLAENSGGLSSWSAVWSFRTSVAPPAAPTLVYPPDGAEQIPIGVALRWQKIEDAAGYHLQVAATSDFSTVAYENSTLTDTLHQPGGLKHSTLYYWRVRASNSGGSGPWSATRRFATVESSPTAPRLASPANGSQSQSLRPVLEWFSAAGATSYRVQVSENLAFSGNLQLDATTADTVYSIFTDLAYDRTYYWRVNASNNGGTSQWSAIWTFRTIIAPPASPTLSSPPNDATNQPTALELEWSAVQSADFYHVQLSPSNSFANLVVDSSGITGTRHPVSGLEQEKTYFWRARSANEAGPGPWSQTWKFTTAPADPRAPQLTSPPNGSTGVPTNPTLTWESVLGATGYDLQVSTTTDFSAIVIDESGLSATSYQVSGLQEGTTYFWRVRSIGITGRSGWSTVWGFTTLAPKPAPPALLLPEDGARDLATTLRLSWNPVETATSYRLEVSQFAGFSTTVLDSSGLREPNFIVESLEPATSYYWRVFAINSSGSSAPSVIRSFVTVNPSSFNPLHLALPFPPAESAQSYDYRLVGMPGVTTTRVQDIFPGSHGLQWKAYWDNGLPADYLVEVNSQNSILFGEGRGFWIIHDGILSIEVPVSPYPLNSSEEAEIPLHAGWNIITNPFSVPVVWSAVQSRNGTMESLYAFQGGFSIADTLEPYHGYYFFNEADRPFLQIPYSSQTPAAAAGRARQEETSWQVTIALKSGHITDETTRFGIAPTSSDGYDRSDTRKPRSVGGIASAFFQRPDWDSGFSRFASDIRSAIDSVHVWNVRIAMPTTSEYELQLRGIEYIPAEYDVYLVDRVRKRTVNLRLRHSYEFASTAGECEVEIVVGRPESVGNFVPRHEVPHEIHLAPNYPNPFNASTVISFSLPAREEITMSVFNALGQEVAVLHRGVLEAGQHSVLWRGVDAAGVPVSSGLYFCRLTGRTSQLTQKMLLLK